MRQRIIRAVVGLTIGAATVAATAPATTAQADADHADTIQARSTLRIDTSWD